MSKKIILAWVVILAILGINLSPLSANPKLTPPPRQHNIQLGNTLEQRYLNDVMKTEQQRPFYQSPQASWKKSLSEVFTNLRSSAQQSIANLYFKPTGQPLPIFQTTLAAQLHQGLALVPGSADLTTEPRQASMILAVAPTSINTLAKQLSTLSVGTLFYIHTGNKQLTYSVTKRQIIDNPVNAVTTQPTGNDNYVALAVPVIQNNKNVTLVVYGQLLANAVKDNHIPKQWFMPIALLTLMVIISLWVFWATYHIVWQIFFK